MNDLDDIVVRPNKSQAKRDAAAVLEFAQRLSRLNAKQYEQFDLPDEVCEALKELATLGNKAARNRQIKFVSSLIRKSPRCAEIMALNLNKF